MQRCRARSKRSGEQCKNYSIKGYSVCRMHGAYGGPKTRQGYLACKKGSHKHGFYSQEAKEEMRFMRELTKAEKMHDKYIDKAQL